MQSVWTNLDEHYGKMPQPPHKAIKVLKLTFKRQQLHLPGLNCPHKVGSHGMTKFTMTSKEKNRYRPILCWGLSKQTTCTSIHQELLQSSTVFTWSKELSQLLLPVIQFAI